MQIIRDCLRKIMRRITNNINRQVGKLPCKVEKFIHPLPVTRGTKSRKHWRFILGRRKRRKSVKVDAIGDHTCWAIVFLIEFCDLLTYRKQSSRTPKYYFTSDSIKQVEENPACFILLNIIRIHLHKDRCDFKHLMQWKCEQPKTEVNHIWLIYLNGMKHS